MYPTLFGKAKSYSINNNGNFVCCYYPDEIEAYEEQQIIEELLKENRQWNYTKNH